MFLERLAQAAVEKCTLSQGELILLGVSGGADSLVLLHGLIALGYNLVIAHMDHALRPGSHLEADFVQELAESQGLTFVRQRIDVGEVAEAEGLSLEEAARHVRYPFLFEQARTHRCQAVAVAHHADDQVETVLMHFLRGAALPGLTGMAYRRLMPIWDSRIPLVRPLLGFWREEIETYLAWIGWQSCVDESNLDIAYHRNRIRHALIPELATYNPQIKAVMWRMAEVLDEENHFLDTLTENAYKGCSQAETDDRIELCLPKFLDLSNALQRRVLRLAISRLRPDLRDVGFDAIIRGLDFAENPSGSGEIDLVARVNLAVIEDVLIIKTWAADLPDFEQPLLPTPQFTGLLEIGQSIELKHGWRVEASLLSANTEQALAAVHKLEPYEAWMDLDQLELPLLVRGRKKGERFQPLGMGGQSQRLQDFFVNKKIPAHLRAFWPLVISGEKLAWVVGLRASDSLKITWKTHRILRLKLIKPRDLPG